MTTENRLEKELERYRGRLYSRASVSALMVAAGVWISLTYGVLIPETILGPPLSLRNIRDPVDRREAESIWKEQYSSLSKYAQDSTFGIIGLGALAYFGLGTASDLSKIVKRINLENNNKK